MSRDPLSRQILISGRTFDAMTGERPRSVPDVAADGARGLLVRTGTDGLFSVSVQPDIEMPRPGDRISLRVVTPGYQDAVAPIVLTAVQLARVDIMVRFGAETAPVAHFTNLPIALDLPLTPRAVALKGRVSDADAPATALVGATVRVTAPVPLGPVLTDAGGFFSLAVLPVAPEIGLRISATNHLTADVVFRPDFSRPINQGAFALTSI